MDWSIKIGDLLTMATIVVSVTALLISWSKDRDSRQKEQANQVRVAVGTAVAKLDRLQALHLSAFQELQPVFVDTGEMLTRDFNVVAARDFLVKSINGQRTKIVGKALDEHIETAYIGLFSHFPAIRPLVNTTSVGCAPTAWATRCLASSIARRAARPYSWRLDALPNLASR